MYFKTEYTRRRKYDSLGRRMPTTRKARIARARLGWLGKVNKYFDGNEEAARIFQREWAYYICDSYGDKFYIGHPRPDLETWYHTVYKETHPQQYAAWAARIKQPSLDDDVDFYSS